MLRLSRSRSVSFYYAAWRLHLARNERRETSEIRKRAYMRTVSDPISVSETEFLLRYRLSKEAFKYLCDILRSTTTLRSSKRISLEIKVLCALSFYATGSYQRLVGMGKNIAQTSVSKYVEEVTEALNTSKITSTFIKFPTSKLERDIIKEKFYRKYGIPGVCGCIDGSHFKIFTPNKEIEHLYYSRKHFHSINVQIVCDSDCRIIGLNAKYGGATHDAFIWENSAINHLMQQLHLNNEQVWLLGDSGYPQRPWLMTPIPDAVAGSPEANYTFVHSRARVLVENTLGRLKNRWRCLNKDRTLHYKPEKCAKIIIACSILHNIALNFGVTDIEHYIPSESDHQSNHLNSNGALEEYSNTAQDDLFRGRAVRNRLVHRIITVE